MFVDQTMEMVIRFRKLFFCSWNNGVSAIPTDIELIKRYVKLFV